MNLFDVSSHTIDIDRLPENPVVLDVGCRNFDFTDGILNLRPNAKIYALDPDKKVVNPDTPNVFKYDIALVHDDRKESKYTDYSTGEGNFLTNLNKYYDAKIYVVECQNITTFMSNVGVAHWDVVKLDCEGSEFGILENWPGPIATQISVEFHDYNQRTKYNSAYYRKLFEYLGKWYKVLRHELIALPNGATGHWDSILVLK